MVLIDAAITASSFMLAYFFKFYVLEREPGVGVLPVYEYFRLLWVIVPLYMVLYYMCSVYTPKRTVRIRFEVYGIVKANFLGLIVLILYLFLIVRELNYSRAVIAFFYLFNVGLTSTFRFALRRGLRSARRQGYNLKHILLAPRIWRWG